MSAVLIHRGLQGSAELVPDRGMLRGRLLHVDDDVPYEGQDFAALRVAFERAVERHLARCAALGIAPERSYSGAFQVRVKAATHRALARLAASQGKSLNTLVADILDYAVQTDS